MSSASFDIESTSALIVCLTHDPKAHPAQARLLQSIEITEWVAMQPGAIRTWIEKLGLNLDWIESVRVATNAELYPKFTQALTRAGIKLGKPIELSQFPATLQLLSDENRVRQLKKEKQETSPTRSTRRSRVLVVDDSETIRRLLGKIISEDPALEFVGSVEKPSDAERAILELKPDVITLDIHMPEMNGVELLKKLLPRFRIPTVMISSLSKEEGTHVLDALEAGAIDYIQKPSMSELPVVAPLIREKVRNAASARVMARPETSERKTLSLIAGGRANTDALLLIGSSTGGTEALRDVLTQMPAEIPPILVVQHIPAVFSRALADRLNQLCKFEVKEAQDGEVVKPGRVLIAPGGFQMRVKQVGAELRVVIEDTEPVNRHKPSVDALFDSAAKIKSKHMVAAILTGMGADGAKGLLRLRELGARTLAQDEKTSVVYGMPREAARIGAAEHITALQDVAGELLRLSHAKSRAA